MEAMDLNEARIYVGTYAKYNNGSLQGEWVELSDRMIMYCFHIDFYFSVNLSKAAAKSSPHTFFAFSSQIT